MFLRHMPNWAVATRPGSMYGQCTALFSYAFPMVSCWFRDGLPVVAPCVPYGFPMVSLWFPHGFPMDSYTIPIVFLWVSNCFPLVPLCFPMGFLWFRCDSPTVFLLMFPSRYPIVCILSINGQCIANLWPLSRSVPGGSAGSEGGTPPAPRAPRASSVSPCPAAAETGAQPEPSGVLEPSLNRTWADLPPKHCFPMIPLWFSCGCPMRSLSFS